MLPVQVAAAGSVPLLLPGVEGRGSPTYRQGLALVFGSDAKVDVGIAAAQAADFPGPQ